MKFTVVIEKKGAEFMARCREMTDCVASGRDKNDALEKIKAVITKKLQDGSEGGAAAVPHPVSPSPRGPIIVVESHERPDS
jgi:predicted RNase H-like HicB family nuclease